MIDEMIRPFFPQLAKILSFFLLFIVGYKVISLKGGIPKSGKLIVSKFNSLVIILIGGLFTLFVLEPLLESLILNLLKRYAHFALSISIIITGIAIRKLDKIMRWDYSEYGLAVLAIGVLIFLRDINII